MCCILFYVLVSDSINVLFLIKNGKKNLFVVHLCFWLDFKNVLKKFLVNNVTNIKRYQKSAMTPLMRNGFIISCQFTASNRRD